MAETPGEQVDSAIANVDASANAQIEEARLRADAANAEAARIADAALQSEIGNRVNSLNERVEAWQSSSTEMQNRLLSAETAVKDQGTLLGAIAGTLASIQTALAPKQSPTGQQQASGGPSDQTGGSSTGTDQNARPEDQRRPETPLPPAKKRHFL